VRTASQMKASVISPSKPSRYPIFRLRTFLSQVRPDIHCQKEFTDRPVNELGSIIPPSAIQVPFAGRSFAVLAAGKCK
jgi:hypothetical protein